LIKKDKFKETKPMTTEEKIRADIACGITDSSSEHLNKAEKAFSCDIYNGEGDLMWSNIMVAESLGEAHGEFLNLFLSEIEFDVSEVV